MYGAYTFSLTALLGFYFLSLPRELPLGNPAGCSSAGENSESIAVCGAVTSQKYRLCGNERERRAVLTSSLGRAEDGLPVSNHL